MANDQNVSSIQVSKFLFYDGSKECFKWRVRAVSHEYGLYDLPVEQRSETIHKAIQVCKDWKLHFDVLADSKVVINIHGLHVDDWEEVDVQNDSEVIQFLLTMQ